MKKWTTDLLNSNKINNIDDDNYIKQTHEFISNYFD